MATPARCGTCRGPVGTGSWTHGRSFSATLRPLALEWGVQVFAERGERTTFSVATSLSNVCKLLDVELVVEGADTVSGTWGAVGHYTIGALAIEQVKNATLKAFLEANADRVQSCTVDAIYRRPEKPGPAGVGVRPAGRCARYRVEEIFPSPHLNSHGEDIGVVGGYNRDTQSSGARSTGPGASDPPL